MEMYTDRDIRPIETMLAVYEQERELAERIDIETATEQEKAILASYEEGTQFLANVRDSLDFTKASTVEILDFNTMGTQSISLFPTRKEYARTLTDLTNDFDEKFIDAVESTRTNKIVPVLMPYNEYVACAETPRTNPIIAKEIEAVKNPERVVSDVVMAINNVRELKEQYGIEGDTIPNTLATIYERDEYGEANILTSLDDHGREQVSLAQVAEWYKVGLRASNPAGMEYVQDKFELTPEQLGAVSILLTEMESADNIFEAQKKAQSELDKEEIPVEIVESIDGYVLNRSEVTTDNYKEITSKTEEGNEIAYGSAPPKETTVDPALAHGKVQLEEADDVGTIEEEKIEAGADLGVLNEKHEGKEVTEERKEEKSTSKNKSKDLDR